jgi:hypothetical protein
LLFYYYYYYFLWHCSPARAMASCSHEAKHKEERRKEWKSRTQNGGIETHRICYRGTDHFFSALMVLGWCRLVHLAEDGAE